MREELTGKRPSALSAVFREWAAPDGPLADWTRHLDVDWVWYCPRCREVVLVIEEKQEGALQNVWEVTRRLALHHEDRPWGWRVTCHPDGEFSVTGATNDEKHDSFPDKRIGKDELLRWIEKVFRTHYERRGHP